MDKFAYFDSYDGPGWPDEKWLARYFLTSEGQRDFFASGNDSWGLTAEGIDGTDHLPQLKGRVDVNLLVQGNRDLGIMLQWRKTGRIPIQTYYSKGDLSRLHQWVRSVHGDLYPLGLFIPFETAWKAIKEFMEREAALPKSIEWVAAKDIPAGAFPPP